MPGVKKRHLLLFGASGAIGNAIAELFSDRDWLVAAATRSVDGKSEIRGSWVQFDPFGQIDSQTLHALGKFDAVCWAQGTNANDSIYSVEPKHHLEMYRVNCLFLVITLKWLLTEQLLNKGARLCVISSIWQNLARQDKLSYSMTKAALQGFVLSAAADLAADGYLINAILPGVLDTPMTRQNLDPRQLIKIRKATKFNRLPRLDEVARLAHFICSDDNTGITGQFIAADLGFSGVRLI